MTLLHLAQLPAGVTALPSQKDEKEVLSFPNYTLSTQKQEQRDLFTPAEGGADAQETKRVRGAVGAGQGDQARRVPCCRAPGSSAPPSQHGIPHSRQPLLHFFMCASLISS